MSTLKITGWVVFDRNKITRTTVRQPDLYAHERALHITMEVPAALFATPQLRLRLSVDEQPAPDIVDLTTNVENVLNANGFCAYVDEMPREDEDASAE